MILNPGIVLAVEYINSSKHQKARSHLSAQRLPAPVAQFFNTTARCTYIGQARDVDVARGKPQVAAGWQGQGLGPGPGPGLQPLSATPSRAAGCVGRQRYLPFFFFDDDFPSEPVSFLQVGQNHFLSSAGETLSPTHCRWNHSPCEQLSLSQPTISPS